MSVKQTFAKKENEGPMGVPQTFKHLVPWKAYLKVTLPCSEPGGDFAPTKFSIAERQGDKSASKLNEISFLKITNKFYLITSR